MTGPRCPDCGTPLRVHTRPGARRSGRRHSLGYTRLLFVCPRAESEQVVGTPSPEDGWRGTAWKLDAFCLRKRGRLVLWPEGAAEAEAARMAGLAPCLPF